MCEFKPYPANTRLRLRRVLKALQRFTLDNPPDIGRLVDAFSGMHEIFYKDKSKQDSHRTNVMRLNRFAHTTLKISPD